jgi:hypothetical protein
MSQVLYQNQIADPVTCVPGKESEMQSSRQPDLPAPIANLKIQYTKVSAIFMFVMNISI